MKRPIVLAVSGFPPWPVTNGYNLRVARLLDTLTEECDIALLSPSGGALDGHESPVALRDWVRVDVAARGVQFRFSPGDGAAVREAYDAMVARHEPDFRILWHGMDFLATRAPVAGGVLWDCIDSMTLHEFRHARRARRLRARLSTIRSTLHWARAEHRALRRVDHATVVAEPDARMLKLLAPGASRRVHIVPNGVELRACDEGAGESPHPTVVFTGVLDYEPNVLAAEHFARDVWPGIHRLMPEARFIIGGRAPVSEVLALTDLPGVEVQADVPDMSQFLRRSWIAVAPMRSGSGIKNKVLEAWAVGRPVVMYKLATGGLEAGDVCPRLVVGNRDELAASTLSLLRDTNLRREYGRIVHAAAAERSWEAAANRIFRLFFLSGGRPSMP